MEQYKELRLADCACFNLRMVTRKLTQYYDNYLKAAGIKATQFSLLNILAAREQGVSINQIAKFALMDQTTVTRNIELLRKNGLVESETEESDARKKKIRINEKGKAVLKNAMPLWEKAQRSVLEEIGEDEFSHFLKTLKVLKQFQGL